jgi:NADH-quinone oxidoreductase subunit M
MILAWLIIIPVAGGVLAWLLSSWSSRWPRWSALLALTVDLAIVLKIWLQHSALSVSPGQAAWWLELDHSWIPQLGIRFHLAMDGLSLLLVLLTVFLGIMSVVCSWREIQDRVGFFHFNLMIVLGGIIGVFLALDMILFYFFWELMLVPMYFLIGIWGHENRVYAAIKFFIFTQAGGLFMLMAILGLYFIHGQNTGTYTFNYSELLGTSIAPSTSLWLLLGFFIAFAVKLPVVPVHTWLPDAHTEAPTAGSVILAGLLLKTGAYGMLRFAIPFFPEAAFSFAPVAMVLGVIGIIYGAVMAFAQTDIKRLVAYTSISHLGFVLLGIFALNAISLQGAVMQMICHGLSTGALFVVVGMLQERIHTRDMDQMGGLWSSMPRLGGIALFFALASLGLPGLGNFVGEFLVLMGTFKANAFLTVPATFGLVLSVIYALWMIQRTFYGPLQKSWHLPDLSAREAAITGLMAVGLLWLGLNPQPVLDTASPTLSSLPKREATIQMDSSKVKRVGNDSTSPSQFPSSSREKALNLSSPLVAESKAVRRYE